MNTLTFAQSARFLLPFFAAILLPLSVEAQSGLSVSPTSVSVQTNAGTNAPSQTVQVKKRGKPTVQVPWSVVQASANWLSVSPASGVNDGTLTLLFTTSALAVGTYQTSFRVDSTGSSITVPVQVTIAGPLTVTCPANMSVASPDGSPVVVTYNVSTAGGVAPVTVTGAPASGSSFPVGTTPVQVTASSSDGQTASCGFSITVTDNSSPPPPGDWTFCAFENEFCGFSGTRQVRYGANGSYYYQTFSGGTPCTNSVFGDPLPGTPKQCHFSAALAASGVGPQTSITCPAGAVHIFPGTSIHNAVNANPGTTTFCLGAGVHMINTSITPKTGNTFVGEYGAILDGTGWTTLDDAQAAFRAHNQDIDFVTIRNLVIRNLRRAIHTYSTLPDHWTLEYNEIAFNYSGIVFPAYSLIKNNYIHHNEFSGYSGVYAHSSLIESNEIAYNGWEQKVSLSANVTFRNNFFHHNYGGAIWYDSDNTGALVEGNRLEDNGWLGVFYEISSDIIIRNNAIRRNGDAGVMLGTSQNAQIYNNIFENNFRGITYFVECAAVGGGTGTLRYELANNSAHDNTITVGTQSGAFASVFTYSASCTSAQVETYTNGSKNLTFMNNTYDVPSPDTGQYWFWAGLKTWTEWRALGHDTTGTVR